MKPTTVISDPEVVDTYETPGGWVGTVYENETQRVVIYRKKVEAKGGEDTDRAARDAAYALAQFSAYEDRFRPSASANPYQQSRNPGILGLGFLGL